MAPNVVSQLEVTWTKKKKGDLVKDLFQNYILMSSDSIFTLFFFLVFN